MSAGECLAIVRDAQLRLETSPVTPPARARRLAARLYHVERYCSGVAAARAEFLPYGTALSGAPTYVSAPRSPTLLDGSQCPEPVEAILSLSRSWELCTPDAAWTAIAGMRNACAPGAANPAGWFLDPRWSIVLNGFSVIGETLLSPPPSGSVRATLHAPPRHADLRATMLFGVVSYVPCWWRRLVPTELDRLNSVVLSWARVLTRGEDYVPLDKVAMPVGVCSCPAEVDAIASVNLVSFALRITTRTLWSSDPDCDQSGRQ